MPTMARTTSVSAEIADPLPHTALRARIAWLCHLARAAAVGWAAWTLIVVVWVWSDPAKIVSNVGHCLNADLGAMTPSQFALASGVSIAAWIAEAAVAYCIWRLFGAYLSSRIFTADAAAWMQRIGVAGLIAVLVSIVGRRIDWLILTSHVELPLSTRLFTQFIVPSDLLQVLFCLFVLAVGHVFRSAVQIADDNASIV
jgi:branched-subunit amino acid transport protein